MNIRKALCALSLCVRTMNAFRKLLLAPVALGLAAPLAAQAQSFDMGNVNRYTLTARHRSHACPGGTNGSGDLCQPIL